MIDRPDARGYFGQYGGKYNHASRIVGRYPEGKEVQVYCKPSRPEVAVLEPGVSWSSFIALGLGLFVIVVSVLAILAAIYGKVT